MYCCYSYLQRGKQWIAYIQRIVQSRLNNIYPDSLYYAEVKSISFQSHTFPVLVPLRVRWYSTIRHAHSVWHCTSRSFTRALNPQHNQDPTTSKFHTCNLSSLTVPRSAGLVSSNFTDRAYFKDFENVGYNRLQTSVNVQLSAVRQEHVDCFPSLYFVRLRHPTETKQG